MFNLIRLLYPGISNIELIYVTKVFKEIKKELFWKSTKDYNITFCFAKSDHGKVLGFLCPMQWKEMKEWTKV